MKQATKDKLKEAKEYCDENDKSTEFMLEYMQDFANVDLDCVMKYLEEENKKIIHSEQYKLLDKAIEFGTDLEAGNIERDYKYESQVEQFLKSI